MNRLRGCALSALAFTLMLSPFVAHAAGETFFFGIPPQQSPVEIAKRWTPVIHYLNAKTSIEIQLKTAKDLTTFHQQLKEGQLDFSYVNPQTYIELNKSVGYFAIVKEKGGTAVGLIVTQKDGAIKDVAQLNGQTLAFPGPTAFMATTLPMSHLKDKGVTVQPQYVVSIDSVYRAVAKGLFPAGGGEGRTFGALDPAVKKELTVLWESNPLPPAPFFAHPRVPKDVIARLQKAIDDMDQDTEGKAILQNLNFKGLEKAQDSDYDVVRKMNFGQAK